MTEKKPSNLTVATLQRLYTNSLSSTLDGQILTIQGFYFQKNGKLYGKYYYEEIVGKEKKHRITALFSSDLREQVEEGKYYLYEGFIGKAQSISNDSKLNIFFTVTRIIKHEKKVQLISKAEYDIIQARFERDFPLIDDILLTEIGKGNKPILDIVTGVQSTSQDDYMSQLVDSEYYRIRHHRCNLSSKVELIEFLDKYDFSNTDLLIIIRGGGSGLEVFNEMELCKKAIELSIPFITGIGHDADKTLLEKVSDRGFSTPTAVGAFLQGIVKTYMDRTNALKAKDEELVKLKKQTENETKLLSNQILTQKRTLNKIWIVLVVLIAIIGILAFKMIN
ncbi:exodeoxyribonuclease VII large subunit [Hyunsoonleella rubra]|uniref:Exodeoxyribonuclease VII large subunit n=1 Tax=Hyunsoonleella rubra TaxID=1737062 RepID=A0ABW5TAK4_9FLAO